MLVKLTRVHEKDTVLINVNSIISVEWVHYVSKNIMCSKITLSNGEKYCFLEELDYILKHQKK